MLPAPLLPVPLAYGPARDHERRRRARGDVDPLARSAARRSQRPPPAHVTREWVFTPDAPASPAPSAEGRPSRAPPQPGSRAGSGAAHRKPEKATPAGSDGSQRSFRPSDPSEDGPFADAWQAEGLFVLLGFRIGKTQGLPTRDRHAILGVRSKIACPTHFRRRMLDSGAPRGRNVAIRV
jgi:hypothetical protein